MNSVLSLCLVAAVFAACSGRHLPPGTPPPEYEAPLVTPWSPDANDAGTDATSSNAGNDADAPTTPPTESDLSLDAGPR